MTRTRKCDSPSPQYGGKDCFGEGIESRKCLLRRCQEETTVETTSQTTVLATTETVSERIQTGGNVFQQFSNLVSTSDLISLTENEAEYCFQSPPHIFGYQGPLKSPSSPNEELGRLQVNVGAKVYYRCSNGKVTNLRTNQNTFSLICQQNGTFSLSSAPICSLPTHCIGPALSKSLVENEILVPRRDVAINTPIKVVCTQERQLRDIGSCFPDGKYRFLDKSPCNQNGRQSQSSILHNICDSNPVSIILTSENQFGWIDFTNEEITENGRSPQKYYSQTHHQNSDSDPFKVVSNVFDTFITLSRNNSNSNRQPLLPIVGPKPVTCRYKISVPMGFAIRLGVERKGSRHLKVRDLAFSEQEVNPVRITNSQNSIVLETNGHRILVEAKLKENERIRMNFQLIQP